MLFLLRNERRFAQMAFAFRGFRAQDMAAERLVALEFSGSGFLEPFLGSGIRFNFRHRDFVLIVMTV